MKRLAFLIVLVGCGNNGDAGGNGASGLPNDELIVDFGPGDADSFCAYETSVEGTTPIDCGGGVTLTPKSMDECVAGTTMLKPSCTVTVAQAETCVRAIAASPCTFGGSACQALVACANN